MVRVVGERGGDESPREPRRAQLEIQLGEVGGKRPHSIKKAARLEELRPSRVALSIKAVKTFAETVMVRRVETFLIFPVCWQYI
jgi:hypothetical protein